MSEPSLDRTRLSGHQGHHLCALRKNRHGGPKAVTLCLLPSPKPGDGSTTSGSAAFRHEQEWPAFFWSAERRGAGAVVGYGRSVVRYLVSRICRNHRSLRKAEVGPRGCLNAPGPVVRLSHVCLPHNANRRYPYAPSPSLELKQTIRRPRLRSLRCIHMLPRAGKMAHLCLDMRLLVQNEINKELWTWMPPL